jgi:ubiquinone/menaquinone biosynthesis C-methylase UbiE
MELALDDSRLESLVHFFGKRPGRLKLTGQAAKAAKLGGACLVLEVGCGDGTSALFLSREYACNVIGVDASDRIIALAKKRTEAERVSQRVQFLVADAMQLPFLDYVFDAVVCEAVFSGLVVKEKAAEEFHRVLKSGGRVVITDFVLRKELSPELQCQMACFLPCAGAKRLEEYVSLLEKKGFQNPYTEDHPEEMKRIAYWIALNYGSVAKFFAKVATGMYCLSKEARYSTASIDDYKKFFNQSTFGYALIALTKP